MTTASQAKHQNRAFEWIKAIIEAALIALMIRTFLLMLFDSVIQPI